jgi:hypothetical protein
MIRGGAKSTVISNSGGQPPAGLTAAQWLAALRAYFVFYVTDAAKIDVQVQKPVAPPLQPKSFIQFGYKSNWKGGFIWRHHRVFLISFPSPSYVG